MINKLNQVILLDNSFNFIDLISTKKSVRLICKNKVEVIKTSKQELHKGFYEPKVIRLLKSIDLSMTKKIVFSKLNIYIRDEGICSYCGAQLTPKNATVDHIHPVCKGGKNSFLNCTLSCKPCNSRKGNKLLSETNLKLRKQPAHPSFLDFSYLRARMFGIDIKDIWN